MAAGTGMVPVLRMSLPVVPSPACTHQLKNKGNDSKTGSRAGWCTNMRCSRSSKHFSTHLLVLERMGEWMGVPCALRGPFWGPL